MTVTQSLVPGHFFANDFEHYRADLFQSMRKAWTNLQVPLSTHRRITAEVLGFSKVFSQARSGRSIVFNCLRRLKRNRRYVP